MLTAEQRRRVPVVQRLGGPVVQVIVLVLFQVLLLGQVPLLVLVLVHVLLYVLFQLLVQGQVLVLALDPFLVFVFVQVQKTTNEHGTPTAYRGNVNIDTSQDGTKYRRKTPVPVVPPPCQHPLCTMCAPVPLTNVRPLVLTHNQCPSYLNIDLPLHSFHFLLNMQVLVPGRCTFSGPFSFLCLGPYTYTYYCPCKYNCTFHSTGLFTRLESLAWSQ